VGSEVTILVEPPTVTATRTVLEALAGSGAPIGVVGWADLTAPNLVDLLDELVTGPGGAHLTAIGLRWPVQGATWSEDPTVIRGLACLERSGLALRLVGRGGPGLVERLAAVEPGLTVLTE
jgi:L-fuconolactonase